MGIMTAKEAAKIVKTKMGNDHQPKGFTAAGNGVLG